ncbi:hypothetical protein O5169_27830 [Escherichia coli]|nr:hypothetical protein [Escherichia coli]
MSTPVPLPEALPVTVLLPPFAQVAADIDAATVKVPLPFTVVLIRVLSRADRPRRHHHAGGAAGDDTVGRCCRRCSTPLPLPEALPAISPVTVPLTPTPVPGYRKRYP